jgi:hypothetical protein
MSDRDARAREIMQAVAAVLLQDWDPLGVNHVREAQDEYDGYVGAVYRLIASGATTVQIAEHLRKIEFENMGLWRATVADLLPVAEKLLTVDIRLTDGSVA